MHFPSDLLIDLSNSAFGFVFYRVARSFFFPFSTHCGCGVATRGADVFVVVCCCVCVLTDCFCVSVFCWDWGWDRMTCVPCICSRHAAGAIIGSSRLPPPSSLFLRFSGNQCSTSGGTVCGALLYPPPVWLARTVIQQYEPLSLSPTGCF